MTLKEELEILRGAPIRVNVGDPMEIPCIETSDSEKLCKNPVVSVHMITYNHEPYIRQAIEGVMMQKTDFEFELVIGEDCSTDNTREICFEYQKKYPDKIRVLWWHENITVKHPHPAGGNARRVTAHCRGEFIAFCEGDDYWIDPLKLQKQVDVMRSEPMAMFVCCAGKVVDEEGNQIGEVVHTEHGMVDSLRFVDLVLSQFWFGITTPAVMYRRVVVERSVDDMPFSKMCFRCGDTQMILTALTLGTVYFIEDKMVSYRRHKDSATGSERANYFVGSDGLLIRYAFSIGFKGRRERRKCLNRYLNYVLRYGGGYVPRSLMIKCFMRMDLMGKVRYLMMRVRRLLESKRFSGLRRIVHGLYL